MLEVEQKHSNRLQERLMVWCKLQWIVKKKAKRHPQCQIESETAKIFILASRSERSILGAAAEKVHCSIPETKGYRRKSNLQAKNFYCSKVEGATEL